MYVFPLQPGSVIFGDGPSDLNITTCKIFDDGNHTDLQDYIQKVSTHSGIMNGSSGYIFFLLFRF